MSPASRATSEAIKVVFRVRPLNSKEIKDGRTIITKAIEDRGSIEVTNPDAVSGSGQIKHFSFDAVFSESSSQRLIYDTCAAPVVESVLKGYNGTIFCYGQTGAGKTHTMEGVVDDPDLRGIIPNAFQHIFDHAALKDSNETMLVRASYFEIYNEEIRDLLSQTPTVGLELKESSNSGIYVKGLSSTVVKSFIEIDKVMQMGKKNRSVASTLMNAGSSRSHSVFTVVIESCTKDKLGEDHIRMGKLNLVDLAGSERQTKTGATGNRLKEATKINLSLSALGNVISALVDGKSNHVPYRDSKLTRILQDSLGGNTKTVMCANAGPAEYNYDETLSTLRYANRAKNIKNKPIINEDPKDAMLREYQDEISKLKAQLAQIPAMPETALCSKEKDLESKLVDASDERKYLQVKLEEESRSRAETEKQRCELEHKLRDIEASLMSGGDISSKAARQEAELRKAEQALIAKRESQLALARKIEEQEETHFQLNEKYTSLNDEVRSKTKKLKKLWAKYTHMVEEKKEEAREFQSDKSDLLESIRFLNKQLKLKDLIISNFIPPKYVAIFYDDHNGGRAIWNESAEEWELPHLHLAGNNTVTPVPSPVPPSNISSSTRQTNPGQDLTKEKNDHSNPRQSKRHVFLDLELHIPKEMGKLC